MIIELHDYTLPIKVGCFERERLIPQDVIVSLVMSLGDAVSCKNDELEETLDYLQVVCFLEEVYSFQEFKLLETLVEDMGDKLLHKFPMISHVNIKVGKVTIQSSATKGAKIIIRKQFNRGVEGS